MVDDEQTLPERLRSIDSRSRLGPGEDWVQIEPEAVSAIAALLAADPSKKAAAEGPARLLLMEFGLLLQDINAMKVMPDKNLREIVTLAEEHVDWLISFVSLGYDSSSKRFDEDDLQEDLPPPQHPPYFHYPLKPRRFRPPASHRVRTALLRSLHRSARHPDGDQVDSAHILKSLQALKDALGEVWRSSERNLRVNDVRAALSEAAIERAIERDRQQWNARHPPKPAGAKTLEWPGAMFDHWRNPHVIRAMAMEPAGGRPPSPATGFVALAAERWFAERGTWPAKTEAADKFDEKTGAETALRLRGPFVELLREVEQAFGAVGVIDRAAILNGIDRAKANHETG